MKKFLANQIGMGLLQVLVAGAAVIGGGSYMMSIMSEQKTVSKRAVTKGIYSIIRKDLAETLADSAVCLSTMEYGVNNPLTPGAEGIVNFNVPMIKNAAGDILYDTTSVLYEHKIAKMGFEVEDYILNPAYHYQNSDFAITLEPLDPKMRGRTIKIKIPLYTMLTDNKITSCMSNDAGSVSDAYRDACNALTSRADGTQGGYQEGEGTCLGMHGENSAVARHVKDYFCASNPDTCAKLPYAGQTCAGPQYADVRNVAHNNWVVAGIDTNGNVRCQCLPLKNCMTATEAALYCKGTDLGTNGCFSDCGSGTKTDGACTPCTDSAWKPLASNVCGGKVFTQVSNCGTTRDNQVGTMAEVFEPAASEVCQGDSFTQYSNCGNSRSNQIGTKDCSCILPRPQTWSQTISGTTYNCNESSVPNSTMQNGESIVAETVSGASNSGNAEFICTEGRLYSIRRVCSPLPKTLTCNIHYSLSFDMAPGSSNDGNWIVIRNRARENCGSDGCYLTMGVSCPNSDAEVRVSYQIRIHGNWTPLVTTPWSGMDSNIAWGPRTGRRDGDDDECGGNGGCGLKITAETRGGGNCKVDYGWGIEFIRRTGSDGSNAGFYCTNKKGNPKCEEHGCNEGNGCGMMAKLTCTI